MAGWDCFLLKVFLGAEFWLGSLFTSISCMRLFSGMQLKIPVGMHCSCGHSLWRGAVIGGLEVFAGKRVDLLSNLL